MLDGLEKDFSSEFGDDGDGGGDLLSSIADAASSASSTTSSAVSSAENAVSSTVSDASSSSGLQSLIATVEGATSAAGGVAASLTSGDFVAAGNKALQIVQQAAAQSHSFGSTADAGLAMSAKFASAGATIGSVVPGIGNVIGAVVGAIIGFVAGVVDSLGGNMVTGQNATDKYTAFWKTYKFFSGSPLDSSDVPSGYKINDYRSTWFEKLTSSNSSNGDVWAITGKGLAPDGVTVIPIYDGSWFGVKTGQVPLFKIHRDAYWTGWPNYYSMMQGSGAVALHLTTSIVSPDNQPAMDLFMGGNGTEPVAGIDYALWLASQPTGMKQLSAAPVELQADIIPKMALATATLIYMPYVPVLAAAGCYSPLGIDAVRKAATKQGTAAGAQVGQCIALSVPKDDLTLLLHAFAFLDKHSPLQYVVQRQGIWADLDTVDSKGNRSTVVSALTHAIGACTASQSKNMSDATTVLNKANAALAVPLPKSRIATLAMNAQIQALNWKTPYKNVDCLAGDSQAQIDAKIGLTKKLGGVSQASTPVKIVPKTVSKPKSQLTSHHWWIEATVASLVGIGVYKAVHSKAFLSRFRHFEGKHK